MLCTLGLSACISDFLLSPGDKFRAAPNAGRLILSPESVSLDALGARAAYEAAWWDAGVTSDPGACAWSTDDPQIATVNDAGIVTAVTNGSTTVRATCADTTATAAVGVWQQVATVEVSPDEVDLETGEQVRLSATPRDPNGNLIDRAVSFAWTSSNELYVEVTPDPGNPSRATATRWIPGRTVVEAHAEGKAGSVRVNND